MIENINEILAKNDLSAARSFVGRSSLDEQQQWWKIYKKTFKDAPPPTVEQIQTIKGCYERELTDNGIDDMTQNSLLFMADDSPVFAAFKALDAFFDFNATHQKLTKIRQRPISKKQKKEINDKTPSIEPPVVRYNKFNNQLLQIFNKQKVLTKAIKENIERADVLLELYPFRHEIIKVMESKGNQTGGKDYQFAIGKTEKWFWELYKGDDEDYRRNKMPNFKTITQEIIKRHKNDTESNGTPTEGAIKDQRRKLNLMQYDFSKDI